MFRQRYTCCHIRHTYISLDPRRAGGIFEAPLLKDYDLTYKNTLHNNLEAVLFALRAIYSIANEYKLKRLGGICKIAREYTFYRQRGIYSRILAPKLRRKRTQIAREIHAMYFKNVIFATFFAKKVAY